MKPANHNPPLLLGDRHPIRCDFYANASMTIDGQSFEECEQDATRRLTEDERLSIQAWFVMAPKHTIHIHYILTGIPQPVLCDSHYELFKQIGAIN